MNTIYFKSNFSRIQQQELSLDELLDILGFTPWKTITTNFVLPIVNLIGLIFCFISAFIFFNDRFVNPSFFYYRLFTIVYIVSFLHNIPIGILFSPRFFQQINTFYASMFQVYYIFTANLLFHYGDILQLNILLTRMKTFSPILRKYFTASPPLVSFATFLVCFLIDFWFGFLLKTSSFGTYYYFDDTAQPITF